MKMAEFAVLAAISAALIAVGTAAAWLKRGTIADPAPPVATSAPGIGAFNPTDVLVLETRQLGFIDQWRFDSCMTDAAKNPTAHGVNTAVRVCRRRFDQ